MKDLKVLELNADFIPLNLVPLSTISWRDAFKKIVEETAVPIAFYEGEYIHTVNQAFQVPSVIVLREYKHLKKFAKWSKFNVKLRDNFHCQYCGKRFSKNSLTIDHVLPKAHGHGHSWTNSVAACKPCNQRKKDHIKMQPRRKPYRPDYYELAKKMMKYKGTTNPHWEAYVEYLK